MNIKKIHPKFLKGGAFTIQEYERGVLFSFGKSKGILNPGLHAKIPGASEIYVVDMRPKTYNTYFVAISQDKLPLEVSSNITCKVKNPETFVIRFPQDFDGFFERYLSSVVQSKGSTEICKNMSLNYALSHREEIESSLESFLNPDLSQFGVILNRVILSKLNPPASLIGKRLELFNAEANVPISAYNAASERIKTEARLGPMIHYLQARADIAEKISRNCGDQTPFVLSLVFGGGDYEGIGGGDMLKKLFDARLGGMASKNIADLIGASPEEVYRLEAMKEAISSMKGIGIFNDLGFGVSSTEDIDKKLKSKFKKEFGV